MATKQVLAYEITADAKAAEQSVGSFRTQLRAATQDLVAMAMKFGDNSVEAQNAGKKVAMLRDAIGDAKAMSDTFNPDKKFVALGGAIQGVVSGFSAYSGAMGLLGAKGEEVEKVLLKVQSAMALQQGISGIAGSIDSFKLLAGTIAKSSAIQKIFTAGTVVATTVQKAFGVAVETTSTAFKVLRTAIITTGVGALVVGIGLLIEKLNLFGSATEDATKKQEDLNSAIEKSRKITDEYINSVDRNTDILVKQAKIAGKSEQEIYEIKKNGIYERTKLLFKERDDQAKIGGDLKKINEDIAKNQMDYENLVLDNKLRIVNEERSIEDKRDADNAAREEKRKAKAAKDAEELAQKKIDDEAFVTQLLRDAQYEQDKVKWDAMEKEAADKTFWREWDASEQMYYDDLELTNSQKKVEGYKVLHDIENFLNRERVQQYMDAAETIADIAGRQTVVGKAIAVAITTINTVKGAISAFTGFAEQIPGPVGIALGVVAAAGVVASGVKSVKQILAVKVPGKGIGGGGGSTNIEAPKAPITPQASTTKLDAGSINAVGAATSRSYVLESDVSGNQERITRLNRAARIN